MTSFLKLLIGFIFGLLFLSLSYILIQKEQLILAGVFLGLSAISLFVWGVKKNLTYRFLYPGMLAFALFTILPIIFSVFISFTNLGTGHFFSQEKVTRILLNEKVIVGEGQAVNFSLVKNGNEAYRIYVSKGEEQFVGTVPNKTLSKNESISLTKLEEPQNIEPLSPLDVFQLRDILKSYSFKMPNGESFLYHRVDKLLQGKFLYKQDGKSLINTQTGVSYQPNNERGFYISQTQNGAETLEPGFYTFVGLKNFSDLFGKEEFRKTFLKVSVWTFIWALLSVVMTFSLGLSLALFINDKNLKFKAIYRNLLILPYSIPFFISVLVFKGMLNKDFGVVNSFLANLGMSPIPWLENGLWAKVSCLMVNLWLGFPYMFLLTTGILQSIPESVYEAARIDGANKWQSFKGITLPLILSSITPLLIGAFAFNLGNFVGIYLLTGGGPAMAEATTPAGQTDILISYTYRLAFEGAMGQQFGLASSIALFIFVIIGALTALNFKIFHKEQDL